MNRSSQKKGTASVGTLAAALFGLLVVLDLEQTSGSAAPEIVPVAEVEADLPTASGAEARSALRLAALTAPPPPPAAPVADPFAQLESLGIDGEQLRVTASLMGADLSAVERFDISHVDLASIDPGERACLAQAIYYEARNQSLAGQMAVADVILNRVDSRFYPSTICGVVYEGSERVTGCQFSFTCDGSMEKAIETAAMDKSQIVANAILGGFRIALSGDALNYHANYVDPYWAPTLHETAQIDDHIFYRPGSRFRLASLSE